MGKATEEQFTYAAKIIQNLPKDGPIKPTQDQQLTFYSLYKQGTIGDVNIDRPGLFDLTGKAKWDAWKKVQGKSKEDAWTEYVQELVKILKGVNETGQYNDDLNKLSLD